MRPAGMVAVVFVVLMLLAQQHAAAATSGYEAPGWACSPPPKALQESCPGAARGDARCSATACAPDAGCARKEHNAVQGRVDGEVMALDAWLVVHNGACRKAQWTLAECASLCQQVDACGAWAYCNSPSGCGTGCSERHEFNEAAVPPSTISPATFTRLLNPEHRCTPDGGWPQGMCSLLTLDEAGPVNPGAPPLVPGQRANYGWVSGVIVRPAAHGASDGAPSGTDKDREAHPQQAHVDEARETYLPYDPEREREEFDRMAAHQRATAARAAAEARANKQLQQQQSSAAKEQQKQQQQAGADHKVAVRQPRETEVTQPSGSKAAKPSGSKARAGSSTPQSGRQQATVGIASLASRTHVITDQQQHALQRHQQQHAAKQGSHADADVDDDADAAGGDRGGVPPPKQPLVFVPRAIAVEHSESRVLAAGAPPSNSAQAAAAATLGSCLSLLAALLLLLL